MPENKISITTSSFAVYDKAPVSLLKKKGYRVVLNSLGRKLSPEDTLKLCAGSEGVIAGTETYDKSVLERLPGLRVISRCGAGTDNIDLAAAKKLRVKVFNTPQAPVPAVAELAVGLALALLRKVPVMDREIRRGSWKKRTGNLLSGKRAGIIGFGKIGRRTAALLKAFGCEIRYSDPRLKNGQAGIKKMPLRELLGNSDIVFVHASGRKRILGARELKSIKNGSWLVNLSRGGVVEEKALYKALAKGRLSGAAIDVFEKEPYRGPLKKLENVILTPHVGSYAREARVRMEFEAARNLVKGLEKNG